MNSEHPRALDISCHRLFFLNDHRRPTKCSKSRKTLNQSEFIRVFFFLIFMLINRKILFYVKVKTNHSKLIQRSRNKKRKNDCSLMLSLRNAPFTHDKTGSFSYVKEIASWHDNWFSIADSLKLPRHQRFDPLPHPARMVLGNKGNLDCSNYRLHITTHQLQCNILISLSQQTGAKAVSQP